MKARLDAGGISYTEFSYQILQANDYLDLHRRHDCELQIGGSDQWGNLVAGVDLIRRVDRRDGARPGYPADHQAGRHQVRQDRGRHDLADPELMSPYAFYQFWMNRSDEEVGGLLRVFTFRQPEEIEALEREIAERPAARIAQRRLADEMTTLVHGPPRLRAGGGGQPGPVRPGRPAGAGREDAGRRARRGAQLRSRARAGTSCRRWRT